MPLPKNGKSILMTPDPYHTPGYGGFCPQFKYQIGETFGKTTSKLLRDDVVASSGSLVLASIRANSAPAPQDPREQLLQSRTHSWGDQKLMEQMIPGYTGFIPRSEHYFGKRYAVNCKGAITDFESDHRSTKQNTEDLRQYDAVQSGKIDASAVPNLPRIQSRHVTPLQAIAKEPKPYISPNVTKSAESPFYMANENDMKRFMSGYTGFVPRARPRLGMGYPIITHEALNEFTTDTRRLKEIQDQSIALHREERPLKDSRLIYPIESGLVPHYTGHIPGQKFRYGETFGHSTEDAKRSQVRVSV